MLNKVILMGRLTHTPEVKQTTQGTSVLTFVIAVDRNYSGSAEKRTDFINCVAWRQNAEFIAKYFPKGALIAIEGELQQRKYTAKDGSERTIHEVCVTNACFTGERRQDMGDAGYRQPPKEEEPKATTTYQGTDNEERSVQQAVARQKQAQSEQHPDQITIDNATFEDILSGEGVPF